MQKNSVPTDSVTSSFQVPSWLFFFNSGCPTFHQNITADVGKLSSAACWTEPVTAPAAGPSSNTNVCTCVVFLLLFKFFPDAIFFEQGRRREGRASPKVSEVYDFYLTETTARDGKKAFAIFVILPHGRDGLKTAQRPRRRNTESSRSGTSGYVLRPPPTHSPSFPSSPTSSSIISGAAAHPPLIRGSADTSSHNMWGRHLEPDVLPGREGGGEGRSLAE